MEQFVRKWVNIWTNSKHLYQIIKLYRMFLLQNYTIQNGWWVEYNQFCYNWLSTKWVAYKLPQFYWCKGLNHLHCAKHIVTQLWSPNLIANANSPIYSDCDDKWIRTSHNSVANCTVSKMDLVDYHLNDDRMIKIVWLSFTFVMIR